MMKSAMTGYMMALFTIMMWSLNIIYAKYLAGILTPSEISFLRWAIALFVMVPLSYKALQQNSRVVLRHWKLAALMALSGLGLQNWLIYCAGYTASATNMALISILGPIFIIAFSRQKIDFLQLLGVSAAICGVVVIILHGSLSELKGFTIVPGDFYMLGSAFLFAVYALVQKKVPNSLPPQVMLTAGIAVSALIFLIPAAVDYIQAPVRKISPLVWFILLVLGVINSAFAYLSWDIVIKRIGAVIAGTLYYTMPIFSIVAAYVLLHEKIYSSQLWGGLLIVAGILCFILSAAKSYRKENK